MAEFGCPAYIPEGKTSFTRTRRGTSRVAVLAPDQARDLSIPKDEYVRRFDAIDMSQPSTSGLQRTEEHKHGKIIFRYKKQNS